jgi:hypothetical protein
MLGKGTWAGKTEDLLSQTIRHPTGMPDKKLLHHFLTAIAFAAWSVAY